MAVSFDLFETLVSTTPPADSASAAVTAVVVAFVLELAVAEPPARVHPVVLFGRFVEPFDREWTHPMLVGAVAAVALPLLAATVAAGLTFTAATLHTVAGTLVAAIVLFSSTSLRMLLDAAQDVAAATETDVAGARERLPALAGRDPTSLSPGELRSAAVESAAENLADGLVAPLFAFAVLAPLSLPLAAGAAAWVKAVNTLDSMLGYRSKPVGSASARLDDAVMWLPARASAVLLYASSLTARGAITLPTAARAPPSPNSGWPMGALAGILDVRLEKPGVYALNENAALPSVDDATRGVRLVGRAGVLAYLLAGVVAWS